MGVGEEEVAQAEEDKARVDLEGVAQGEVVESNLFKFRNFHVLGILFVLYSVCKCTIRFSCCKYRDCDC